MDISKYLITNIDQINVGDTVVVVTKSYRGRTQGAQYAEVTRKLKTKFELTFENDRKVEYSTRIDFRSIKRYGSSDGYCTPSEYMYPVNDEVVKWSMQENRKVTAYQMRLRLAEMASDTRYEKAGTEEALDIAREIAAMAQRLVELEEEISKVDHEFAAREEHEQ